jgi:hypothetical protein
VEEFDITWSIERRRIEDLIEYPKNPRSLTTKQFDQLKKSLKKFGLTNEPIINTDGTVIGGHQRLRVLAHFGFEWVDVKIPSRTLTDREVEELNIRHNKNGGDWDAEKLGNEWDPRDLIEWGFTEEELCWKDPADAEEVNGDKPEEFKVIVKCLDEIERDKLYSRLREEGYSCKVA